MTFLSACTGNIRYQPLVTHRVWESTSSGKVFDAALRAIHNEDFLIATADREAGIISTDWKHYAGKYWRIRFRINLYIFEEAEGYVAISFKSVVQSADGTYEAMPGSKITKQGYQQITQTLDNFFLEIQRYCGPSVQRR